MTARRLGALGTLVWDTIHRWGEGESDPVVGWGGLAYGLEALEAALPAGWEVVPLVRVGEDRAEAARDLLAGLARVESLHGLDVVPEETNRVEIRYRPDGSRSERLAGGVPPWRPAALAERVSHLDALYVNFISGHELTLEGAEALREAHPGPLYADLHSLFLSVDDQGYRCPRTLPHRDRWLRSFDGVQVNEEEFRLLAGGHEPWHAGADAVRGPVKLLAVTLGARGAGLLAREGVPADPRAWRRERRRGRPVRRFAPPYGPRNPPFSGGELDPTGCGDVWGATFFARLLAGDSLARALARANRQAGEAARHRGAEGLRHRLRGGGRRRTDRRAGIAPRGGGHEGG